MPKIKGKVVVHPPTCGHTGQITGVFDVKTRTFTAGKCAQCGAPAQIEMQMEAPPPPPPKAGK